MKYVLDKPIYDGVLYLFKICYFRHMNINGSTRLYLLQVCPDTIPRGTIITNSSIRIIF